MEKIRLNKYIAAKGIASRREADKLVEAGLVIVNGQKAVNGTLVSDEDEVLVDGKLISDKRDDEKVVLAFNKPVGVTVTERDEHAEKIVMDYIDYPKRVTYAGRLDKDSEGLILLSNDGKLINEMMRGKNGHEKEYYVSVSKLLNEQQLEEFKNGVFIPELGVKTKECIVEYIGDNCYRVVLTQGLNRQIRRMFALFGIKVQRLMRVRILNIELGNLGVGSYRKLTPDEMDILYSIVFDK